MAKETTIEHLHRSLQNAQETIRFVDSKSATVTGLSLLLLSGALGAMNYLLSNTPPYFKMSFAGCLDWNMATAAFLLISFICFCVCLWSSGVSVLPKSPGAASPTLLFPYYTNGDSFELAQKNFGSRAEEEAVIAEYHIQLRVLGSILAQKIPASARSVKAFLIQIWATAFFGVTGLFLVGGN